MSFEDNENFYILDEEKENNIDKSPRNFASYEEGEETDEEEIEGKANQSTWIALLFKIMFNPVEGWKSLRRNKKGIESLQSGCFYPLLALLAMSKFADYFYSVNIGLSQLVTEAVIAFVSFFFAQFCVPMILTWVFPKEFGKHVDSKFGKEYIIVALSTLTLFSIIINILPMIWPILIFLPIWTLYIMFKAVRFFQLDNKVEMKFFVISGASVIGVPLLIEWGLNSILNL